MVRQELAIMSSVSMVLSVCSKGVKTCDLSFPFHFFHWDTCIVLPLKTCILTRPVYEKKDIPIGYACICKDLSTTMLTTSYPSVELPHADQEHWNGVTLSPVKLEVRRAQYATLPRVANPFLLDNTVLAIGETRLGVVDV